MIQLSSRWVFATVTLSLATGLLLAGPLTRVESSSHVEADAKAFINDPNERIAQRIEYKNLLIHDLLHDAISLRTATAEFLQANAEAEVTMSVVRTNYPGRSDFEKTARNVMHFVQVHLNMHPELDRETIRDRLECELIELVHRGV